MTIPTRTFSYIPNTLAQSSQVNTNENTLYAWANGGIDDTNLNHLVGIFASTITATTAAQAKFGTNPASTVGFQFIAPAANLTPLTVSGVTSQSADIFDVTLTSGGTKALFVTATGHLAFGAIAPTSDPTLPYISGDAGAVIGMTFNVPSASTNGFRWLINNSLTFQVSAGNAFLTGGALFSTAASSPTTPTAGSISTNGALVAQKATGDAGVVFFGGSTKSAEIGFNENVSNSFEFKDTASGTFTAISGGAYTNASDAALKKNVVPITDGLVTLMKLNPAAFDWIHNDQADIGFIAQEVAKVVPQICRTAEENGGSAGIVYSGITALNSAAIQQMATLLKNAGIPGF